MEDAVRSALRALLSEASMPSESLPANETLADACLEIMSYVDHYAGYASQLLGNERISVIESNLDSDVVSTLSNGQWDYLDQRIYWLHQIVVGDALKKLVLSRVGRE